MQAQKDSGTLAVIKKEALMFERSRMKLEKEIGGIQDMAALPDAVIDVGYHKIAIQEANKLGIPVIGVVDTNHSPIGIDYVIPGNDDSAKAVAVRQGRGRRRARRQGQRHERGRSADLRVGRRVRRSRRRRLIPLPAVKRVCAKGGFMAPFSQLGSNLFTVGQPLAGADDGV